MRKCDCNIMDMNANFAQLKVPDLKKYLQCRGIPILNKRRVELLDLSIKAHEFGIEDLGDDHENQRTDVYNSKLLTKYGTLPEPYSLKSDWPTLALVIASISSSVRSVWTAVSTYRG